MLEGYKHLASSIEETPEKQFASLDVKEKINVLENAMIQEHTFNRDIIVKDSSYGIININKLEGNTVINLAHGSPWSCGTSDIMSSNDIIMPVVDNTYCHVNCYDWVLGKTFMLTPVLITVSFEVFELPKNCGTVKFTLTDETGNYSLYGNTFDIKSGKNCFTINVDPGNAKRLTPRFYTNCRNMTGTSGQLRVKNFCIFEGIVDPCTITEYIKGVDGVGSDGNIKLISCGRNIFNHNLPTTSSGIKIIGENEYETTSPWQTIQIIPLAPNKKFYMSAELKTDISNYHVRLNNVMRMDYHRGNVVPYSEMPRTEGTGTFALPMEYTKFNSGLFYIENTECYEASNVLMRHNPEADIQGKLYAKNIMIQEVMTEDDISHEYEPFISSEVNIKVNSPLHGLPNGVRDTIELVDGDYVIIRRCKELKLGSYLKWANANISSSSITRFSSSSITNIKAGGMVLSNFVPYKQVEEEYTHTGIFISTMDDDSLSCISIDIPNILFNDVSPTVNEFGTWLNSSDYRVIVELVNPIVEKIQNQEEFKKLLMFDGVTHVFGYENTVFPITTIEVPTNLCAEMDSIESAINILEKEVAKMENVGLTSVLTLIDRREEIDNDIQTQDN